jgi:hypothetical protein
VGRGENHGRGEKVGGHTSKIDKIEFSCDGYTIISGGRHMNDQDGVRSRAVLIQICRCGGSEAIDFSGNGGEKLILTNLFDDPLANTSMTSSRHVTFSLKSPGTLTLPSESWRISNPPTELIFPAALTTGGVGDNKSFTCDGREREKDGSTDESRSERRYR